MLKQFECENFKGFSEPLIMDFSASRYDFNKSLIHHDIVSKALVYGKNGSGKSNLGIALFDIVSHLSDAKRMDNVYLQNYLCLNSKKTTARFKYTFCFQENEVVYEYHKTNPDFLVSEKLTVNGKTLLNYHYLNAVPKLIDASLTGNLQIHLTGNRLSILKYIYRNTPQSSESILNKLMNFVNGMLWFRSLSEGNNYAGFTNGVASLDETIYSTNQKEELQKFLKENGVDFDLDFSLFNNIHALMVKFPKGKIPFLSISSTGTSSLYLFFYWRYFFPQLSFLFIDEFDAFLHYESAEYLIKIINQYENLQSVVTTHNTYLMNNKITRPDCCYIINGNQIKNLPACTDKEIREAHNLEKLYINGVFND